MKWFLQNCSIIFKDFSAFIWLPIWREKDELTMTTELAFFRCLEKQFSNCTSDLIFRLRLDPDYIRQFYLMQNFKTCLRKKLRLIEYAQKKGLRSGFSSSFFSFNRLVPPIQGRSNFVNISSMGGRKFENNY